MWRRFGNVGNRNHAGDARQLINREAPPLSLADMCPAFDGWGESYPLPEGAATEPKTLGGIVALKVSALCSSADRALLYMHGGGYAIGSIKSHRHLVANLCEASGFVGYCARLSPVA